MPSSLDFLLQAPTDGSTLVLVPAGPFVAGGPAHFESATEPCLVELPPFYLGLTAVTNVQYARFVAATGHPLPRCYRAGQPRELTWNDDGTIPAGLEEHPVVGVRHEDARAYCAWAGLRLPTELEWEKGARGLDGRLFPWGNDWDEARCRHDDNRKNGTTCPVGEHGTGASPWGLYQVAGNVWEWCEDWYEPGAYRRYRKGDLSLPPATREHVARGGSWFNVLPESFRVTYRHHFPDGEADRHYGFRVAASCGGIQDAR